MRHGVVELHRSSIAGRFSNFTTTAPSEERVDERRERRGGGEDEEHPEQQQNHHEGNEPPFLLLPEKKQKLFEDRPHACGISKQWGWPPSTVRSKLAGGPVIGKPCLGREAGDSLKW